MQKDGKYWNSSERNRQYDYPLVLLPFLVSKTTIRIRTTAPIMIYLGSVYHSVVVVVVVEFTVTSVPVLPLFSCAKVNPDIRANIIKAIA